MKTESRTRILIVYTGGTIGMIEDPATKALVPFNFDHLIDNVPKIKMLDFDIDHYQFGKPIDSSDMDPAHWDEIAHVIEERYDDYDGFVVLHGTDTMAYTASALSFMLENLAKPVIITGSQLPIGEVRTDGEENLITALQVAAEKDAHGGAMVREVAILFENYLWRGNRSTKRSADDFNAFFSNNYPELGEVGLSISYNTDALWRRPVSGPLRVHYGMDPNVVTLDLFPGISETTVRHLLSTPGVRGVVIRTYGAGNAPTAKWLTEAVREAVERGVVVVNITQCSNGSVLPKRYEAGRALSETGVVCGHDLTCEAALTKLMSLFGRGLSSREVKKYMAYSICGEMTCDLN